MGLADSVPTPSGPLLPAEAKRIGFARPMRIPFFVLAGALALALLCAAGAETDAVSSWPAARLEDVSSVDAIIKASYEALSGAPDKLDLQRFKSLFAPDTRLATAKDDENGKPTYSLRSVDEFLAAVALRKLAMVEREIARRTETYENMVQVWSTYDLITDDNGVQRHQRGINSILLVYDGQRWWIVGAIWRNEVPGKPVPEKYLKVLVEGPG